jgi:hypothetical protein
MWANFQRIIELFTQKIVTKISIVWVWDPGSDIRDPEKIYSGSRGQKGIGSRIRNTGVQYRKHAHPEQCVDIFVALVALHLFRLFHSLHVLFAALAGPTREERKRL